MLRRSSGAAGGAPLVASETKGEHMRTDFGAAGAAATYTTIIYTELAGLLAKKGLIDLQELGNALVQRAAQCAMTEQHELTAVYARELGKAFIDATQPLSIRSLGQ